MMAACIAGVVEKLYKLFVRFEGGCSVGKGRLKWLKDCKWWWLRAGSSLEGWVFYVFNFFVVTFYNIPESC